MLAYVARYAHQPLDVLLGLTLRDLQDFHDAVAGIVEEENRPRK